MSRMLIRGGLPLVGDVNISGSKNAALPVLAATLLFDGHVKLFNLPNIRDVTGMLNIISSVGKEIEFCQSKEDSFYVKLSGSIQKSEPNKDVVSQMRASVLLLGPMLAKFGEAKIYLPGGCKIGSRPIDIHVECLRAMGADINVSSEYIEGKLIGKFIGTSVDVKSSVGATENVITAAVLGKGETIVSNAAMEPEIIDLCLMLKQSGANISGIGTNRLLIVGVNELSIDSFKISPDRIEAGTYACIGALSSNNKIRLLNCGLETFDGVIDIFREIGIGISIKDEVLEIERLNDYKNTLKLSTGIFPFFLPTDLQAQVMTYLLTREGEFEIEENVFENRLMQVEQLQKMGANIEFKNKKTVIVRKSSLFGADVEATDLRASAALVMAALTVENDTCIDKIYHLDRGYEAMDAKLRKIGADINRKII